jgi:hypothetical protein
MMIRLIVRREDMSPCQVGGNPQVSYRTFDVELPEVEAYLKESPKWLSHQLLGFADPEPKPSPTPH